MTGGEVEREREEGKGEENEPGGRREVDWE